MLKQTKQKEHLNIFRSFFKAKGHEGFGEYGHHQLKIHKYPRIFIILKNKIMLAQKVKNVQRLNFVTKLHFNFFYFV